MKNRRLTCERQYCCFNEPFEVLAHNYQLNNQSLWKEIRRKNTITDNIFFNSSSFCYRVCRISFIVCTLSYNWSQQNEANIFKIGWLAKLWKKRGDEIGRQSVMLHGSSNKLNFNLLYQVKELIIEYLLYSTTNFTSSNVIIRYHYVESYNLFANETWDKTCWCRILKIYTFFNNKWIKLWKISANLSEAINK